MTMQFHAKTCHVRAAIAQLLVEEEGLPAVPLADLIFATFREAVEEVVWDSAWKAYADDAGLTALIEGYTQ